MLARLNCPKSELVKPYRLTLLVILIPLATAKDTLKEEKLPGPQLTNMEKLLSIFTLCFLNIFNTINTNCSLSVFLSKSW